MGAARVGEVFRPGARGDVPRVHRTRCLQVVRRPHDDRFALVQVVEEVGEAGAGLVIRFMFPVLVRDDVVHRPGNHRSERSVARVLGGVGAAGVADELLGDPRSVLPAVDGPQVLARDGVDHLREVDVVAPVLEDHGGGGRFTAGRVVRQLVHERDLDGGAGDLALADRVRGLPDDDRAGLAEVDLAVLHIPGAVLVAERAVGIEVDLAGLDSPPAVLVLGDAGVGEVDLAVLRLPPAVPVLVDALRLEVDLAGLDAPPAVLVLLDPVEVEVDAAVLHVPPAVLVLVDTGGLRLDLAVHDAPPAFDSLIGRLGDAGVVRREVRFFRCFGRGFFRRRFGRALVFLRRGGLVLRLFGRALVVFVVVLVRVFLRRGRGLLLVLRLRLLFGVFLRLLFRRDRRARGRGLLVLCKGRKERAAGDRKS